MVMKSIISMMDTAHDWGGPLSARIAIDHLDRVDKLMLLDTFLWNLTWNDFPKEVKLSLLRKLLFHDFNIFFTPEGSFQNVNL